MADALGRCNCRSRRKAQQRGEFLYDEARGAWVFPDVTRTLSPRARFFEAKVADHTGEPFTWDICPFCGLDFPTRRSPEDVGRDAPDR
jgi:hypothetical protein